MPKSAANSQIKAILVCGVPGSGKTTYCAWLSQEKGFDHLDFDLLFLGRGKPVHLELFQVLKKSHKDFIHKILRKKKPTVIDWGFPPTSLDLVRFFKKNGIKIWWFDGDREAALQSFNARGTVSTDAFNVQMGSIEQCWAQIKEVIGNQLINSVMKGPKHLPPETIFEEMFGRATEQGTAVP